MRLSGMIETSLRNLLARKRRTLFLTLSVAVGIALLLFLTAFSYGVKALFFDKMIRTFPATQIEVKPRRFMVEQEGSAKLITEETIESIRHMPGVRNVLPMTGLTFPTMMASTVIRFQSECAVYGIETDLIAQDLSPEELAAFEARGEIVPVVIASSLIDIYNANFAESRNIPRVNREFLLSNTFDLYLGVSTVALAPTGKVRRVQCRIVGTSPQAPIMGISVPARYVDEWETWYHAPQESKRCFVSLLVNTESPLESDRVAAAISGMGLIVTSGKEAAEKLAAIARLVTGFISVITVAILFLVGIGILNGLATSVMEQSVRIGILRASGATKADVLLIFLIEAMLIGLAGGVAGVGIGFLLTHGADYVAHHCLPSLPYMPESFFVHSSPLTLLILAFAVVIAGASGLPPALRAANLDPAEALRSG